MKREIKFRAWDIYNKRWVYFILKQIINGEAKGCNYERWCLYTGLKDKQGKEIYEGDIVKGKFGILYEVEMGKFVDTKFHIQSGFYLYDFQEKITIGNMGYNSDEKTLLEIIGNIYENKGLLKGLN